MNEQRTLTSTVRRVALPLLVALVLIAGTVLISGSHLIRTEDVIAGRVIAGTYGTPDWRVQEMNPLLSQVLSLLYRVIPSVNWYGVMLLALLALIAASGIGLTARKKGGLIPAIMVVSPIIVLLTNSVISTTVSALCATVGALSLMDGIQRRRDGVARAVLGGILFAFGVMLHLQWGIILGVGAVLCWLPCSVRDSRLRGLLIGLPVMAVIAAALFGYSALMYGSPELSAYRDNYALYNKLQHSSLRGESDVLLEEFGFYITYEDETSEGDDHGHDHDDDEFDLAAELEALFPEQDNVIIPPNSFDTVGWTINDASLFFTRSTVDSTMTDPEVLAKLDAVAKYWDFTPSRLWNEFYTTVKKPQFLLLIGLYVLSALAVLITSRRKGLIVLLTAVIAFGGHIIALARYYDAFADIAPFYLLAIAVLLYYFDGEDAKAWLHRALTSAWLRIAACSLALVVFVLGMGGLLYYTRITPAYANRYVADAVAFLKPYIAEHQDILYIGDNPNERDRPATLSVPVRGEDATLLAGSYDLYSPRAASMMAEFGVTNPLVDAIGREDIAYVLMGFSEPITFRMITAYDTYLKQAEALFTYPNYAESIVLLDAFTQAEIDAMIAENARQQEEMAALMEAMAAEEEAAAEDGAEAGEEEAAEAEATEAPTQTPTPSPAPTATGNG